MIASSVVPVSAVTQGAVGEMTALEMRCALHVCEVAIALGPDDTVLHWANLLVMGAREVFFKKEGNALSAAWFSCLAAVTCRSKTPLPLTQLVAHVNAANPASGVSPSLCCVLVFVLMCAVMIHVKLS